MATTAVESNKEMVRKYFKLYYEGDIDDFEKYRTEDSISREPGREPLVGVEAVKEDIRAARAVFPDLHVEINDMVAEGDAVVVDWTLTGTHEGEVDGLEPTGNSFENSGIAWFRLEDGKIVEDVHQYDCLNKFVQLGVMEPPEL